MIESYRIYSNRRLRLNSTDALTLSLVTLAGIRLVGTLVFLDLWLQKRDVRFLLLVLGWLCTVVASAWGLYSHVALGQMEEFYFSLAAALGTFWIGCGALSLFGKLRRRTILLGSLLIVGYGLLQPLGLSPGIPSPGVFIQLLIALIVTYAVLFKRHYFLENYTLSAYIWLIALAVLSDGMTLAFGLGWFRAGNLALGFAGTSVVMLVAIIFFLHLEYGISTRQLQSSEQRYMRLAENAQDLIYRYRFWPERGFEYVSPSATAITGFSPEDHYADPDLGFKLIHPEDRHLLEATAGGEFDYSRPLTLRWVRKDGEIIWTEQRNVPIYDDEGRLIAIEGIARDVTERMRIEQAVRAEKAWSETIISSAPVIIVGLGERSEILIFNRFTEQLTGYSSAEVVGKNWIELFIPPEDRADLYRLWEEIVAQQLMRHQHENEILLKSGERRWIRWNNTVLSEGGKFRMVLSFGEDITAQRQAQQAVAQQNRALAALQEISLEVVSQLDLNVLLEDIVRRAGQLMGTDSGFLDLLDPASGRLIPQTAFGEMSPSLTYEVKPGEGIAGRVWQSGQPLVIKDYDHWENRLAIYPPGRLRTIAAVPLMLEDRVQGVLGLSYGYDHQREFTESDLTLLQSFARLAAVAIHNARLFSAARRAETELRQTIDYLQAVLNSVGDAVFVQDGVTGRILDANPRATELYGYTREELRQLQPGALSPGVSPYSRKEVLEWMERARRLGPQTFEWQAQHKDGHLFWVEISLRYAEIGGEPRFVVAAREITQRKEFEAALRETGEYLQAVLDALNDAIFVDDALTGQIIDVNQRMCEMYGYTREQVLHLSVGDLSQGEPPYSQDDALVMLNKARTEGPQTFEWLAKRRDGSLFWVEVSIQYVLIGGKERFVVLAHDITQRKQAEAELRKLVYRMEVLAALGRKLAGTLDLIQICRTTHQDLMELVDCPNFAISLYDPALRKLQLVYLATDGEEPDVSHVPPLYISENEAPGGRLLAIFSQKPVVQHHMAEVSRAAGAMIVGDERVPDSVCYLPMVVEGQTLGLLELQSYQSEAYRSEDTDWLSLLANQIGLSIQNARLLQQVRQRARDLALLNEISREISAVLEQQEMMRQTVKRVQETFGFSDAALFLLQREAGCLTLQACADDCQRRFPPELRLSLGERQIGRAGLERQPVIIRQSKPEAPNEDSFPGNLQTYAEICLPLILGEELLGVLDLLSANPQAFVGDELNLLETLAESVAVALQNARLYESLQQELERRLQVEAELLHHQEHLTELVEERTRELAAAQEQLLRQERLAVMGQLAGGVGHELRNPLAVINNAIYFLRMIQPNAEPKVKEYLEIIDDQVHIADKIITDLLNFGRIKQVEREEVEIGELFEQLLVRYPPYPGIHVTSELEAALPSLWVDAQQILQVLGNLLVNAYQAMPEGGEVRLSARLAEPGMIAIAVQDTGVGILPENMSRLFEPLFTTKVRGIGLGLAVCKKLIEANQGRIEVQSEVGKGSVFTVYLPTARQAE